MAFYTFQREFRSFLWYKRRGGRSLPDETSAFFLSCPERAIEKCVVQLEGFSTLDWGRLTSGSRHWLKGCPQIFPYLINDVDFSLFALHFMCFARFCNIREEYAKKTFTPDWGHDYWKCKCTSSIFHLCYKPFCRRSRCGVPNIKNPIWICESKMKQRHLGFTN